MDFAVLALEDQLRMARTQAIAWRRIERLLLQQQLARTDDERTALAAEVTTAINDTAAAPLGPTPEPLTAEDGVV